MNKKVSHPQSAAAGSQLRIGQLAKLVGVTPKTIRHYHKIGLLPEPARAENAYRQYGLADLYRLKLILRLKAVGFSLGDIRTILQAKDADAVLRQRLETLEQTLTVSINQLSEQRQRVQALLAEPITLSGLDKPELQPSLTYQLIKGTLQEYTTVTPDEVQMLDQALLARLDMFHWGEAYQEHWLQIIQMLSNNLEVFQSVNQQFAAAAHLDEDDPQLEMIASEIAEGLTQLNSFLKLPNLEPPLSSLFQQVAVQSIQEVLNPAQKKLVSLIRQYLHP